MRMGTGAPDEEGVCVCVCVCARARTRTHTHVRAWLRASTRLKRWAELYTEAWFIAMSTVVGMSGLYPRCPAAGAGGRFTGSQRCVCARAPPLLPPSPRLPVYVYLSVCLCLFVRLSVRFCLPACLYFPCLSARPPASCVFLPASCFRLRSVISARLSSGALVLYSCFPVCCFPLPAFLSFVSACLPA